MDTSSQDTRPVSVRIGSQMVKLTYRPFGIPYAEQLDFEQRLFDLQEKAEGVEDELETARRDRQAARDARRDAQDDDEYNKAQADFTDADKRVEAARLKGKELNDESFTVMAEMFTRTVTSWDLVNKGEPIPLTVEGMRETVGFDLLSELLGAVKKDMGEQRAGRSSSSYRRRAS